MNILIDGADRMSGVQIMVDDHLFRLAECAADPVFNELGGAEAAGRVFVSGSAAHVDCDGADGCDVLGIDQALVLEGDDE